MTAPLGQFGRLRHLIPMQLAFCNLLLVRDKDERFQAKGCKTLGSRSSHEFEVNLNISVSKRVKSLCIRNVPASVSYSKVPDQSSQRWQESMLIEESLLHSIWRGIQCWASRTSFIKSRKV